MAAAVVALALVTGCTPKPAAPAEPQVSKRELIGLAEMHLEDKYGATFQFHVASWGGEWDSGLRWNGPDTWLGFYPTGGTPERYFKVRVDPATSPISFHDCYVAELMSASYQERAEAELSAIRPDARVAVVPMSTFCESPTPDDWTGPRPVEEFRTWADTNLNVAFCVYLPLTDGQGREYADEQSKALATRFRKVAGRGLVSLRGYDAAVYSAQVAPALRPATIAQNCRVGGGEEPPIRATGMTGWRADG